VHCDGSADATNVRLTFYAISPPGVGDNGTWTPLDTEILANVAADDSEETFINWVPVVGEHTCLQLVAEDQLGEVTFGNNKAQENVFEFEAPADSVPAPIKIPLAVRNPKNEPSIVLVRLMGIPDGYIVQLPHHWVYLDALGELEMEAIVVSLNDIEKTSQEQRHPLNMVVDGVIPRTYTLPVLGVDPGSRMLPIGGFIAEVTPKHRSSIKLEQDRETQETQDTIGLKGTITPALAGQPVQVVLTDPSNRVRVKDATTDAAGKFSASFDLTLAPTDDPLTGKPGPSEKPLTGKYTAKAYIVSAPDVIQAESNEVTIEKL
jgi:hypothetical protein